MFFQAISIKGIQKFFSGKKGLQKFFFSDLYWRKPKKKSLQIFRKVFGIFQRNFNGSKIVLSSSRGQGNFRGLEASRPRTLKCVLKDVLEAKDVLEDSTPPFNSFLWGIKFFLHYGSLPVLGTDMPDGIRKLLHSWNF